VTGIAPLRWRWHALRINIPPCIAHIAPQLTTVFRRHVLPASLVRLASIGVRRVAIMCLTLCRPLLSVALRGKQLRPRPLAILRERRQYRKA
jgi:hypothetical protein